jgi:hypothetical protein
MNNSVVDELIALAVQYRDDLRHPMTDSGGIERRLKWVSEVLSRVEEHCENEGEPK